MFLFCEPCKNTFICTVQFLLHKLLSKKEKSLIIGEAWGGPLSCVTLQEHTWALLRNLIPYIIVWKKLFFPVFTNNECKINCLSAWCTNIDYSLTWFMLGGSASNCPECWVTRWCVPFLLLFFFIERVTNRRKGNSYMLLSVCIYIVYTR